MNTSMPQTVFMLLALFLGACSTTDLQVTDTDSMSPTQSSEEQSSMLVQYLEIVTTEVDTTCSALEQIHGVSFGEPDAGFGNARKAALVDGGMIGVRAPMAEHDVPIVRPYMRVADIAAALNAAEAAGAMIAMGATEIPGGQGQFAIYILGGTQFGLWQL